MTIKRRIQVIAVITTGGISVLVSCLRLIVIYRFIVNADFLWEVGNICIVSAAEMEVAIIASNMPGLRALYKLWTGGTLSTNGRSSKQTGDNPRYASGQESKGVQLSMFSSNKKRPARGAERLEDNDDDEDHKHGEHSSTRELTKRTASDEELAINNGAILVTTQYDIQEEREENHHQPGSWTESSRFNAMMKS